jgi:hypothetical protein
MLKTLGRIFLIAVGIALARDTQAQSAQSVDQLRQGSPANPAETSATSNSSPTTADELERALKQHEEAQQQSVTDPARPRTHRYMDQPVARILRSLAEQAEINYVEPGIPENEV